MARILKKVGITANQAAEIFDEQEDGSEVKRTAIKAKMKRADREEDSKVHTDNSGTHEADIERKHGLYGNAAEYRRY